MEQTAVEWVVNQLTPSIALQQKYIDELKEQAKKIEREYLIEFYIKGCEDTYGMDEGHNDSKDASDYYNKIFKS